MTSGGVEPREDVVARAKAALKYAPELPWEVGSDYDPMTGVNTYYLENIERFRGLRNNVYCGTDVHLAEFIAASRSLVPELVAEVERLQTAGPWMEHVERERAMKRERDGDCICNRGPDTDGPDEFCPWHGREYRYLVDSCVSLAAEVEKLRGQPGCCCGGCVL